MRKGLFLFGKTENKTPVSSQKKKPVKGLFKLFSSCLKRSSKTRYNVIKMTDLMDDTNIPDENSMHDKHKNVSPECDEDLISINLIENMSQDNENSNSEGNKKKIKVKITVRGNGITQSRQKQIETIGTSTPLKEEKSDNGKICIIDEFDDDSLSLVLKTPKKEKTIKYAKIATLNNARDNILNKRSQIIEENYIVRESISETFIKKECKAVAVEKNKLPKNTKGPVEKLSLRRQEMFFRSEEQISPIVKPNRSTKQQPLLDDESFRPLLVHRSANYSPKKSISTEAKQFIEHEQRQYSSSNKPKAPLLPRKFNDMSFKKQEPCPKDALKNFIEIEQRAATPKSKYESKSHGADLPVDKSNDSIIIHDIIMEHYQDVLNHFTNKSARRDISRRSMSLIDKTEKQDVIDVAQYASNVSLNNGVATQTNKKSLDSGLHDMATTKSMNTLKSLDQSEDPIEYDPKEFLLAALGEDMMNIDSNSEVESDIKSTPAPSKEVLTTKNDTERSVGTSQISKLITTTESGTNNLYSTVNKSAKKKPILEEKKPVVRSLYTSPAFNHYESVEDTTNPIVTNPIVDQLNRDIYAFQGIIAQALNAVNTCKREPKLYGSIHHLEAERILLLSSCKLDLLNRQCKNFEHEVVEKEQSMIEGVINVGSLKFSNTQCSKMEKGVTYYYLCIFQCGTTVLSSNVMSARRSGKIIFSNNYHLNFNTSSLSEMEINISIYSIRINNEHIKNNSCFASSKMCPACTANRENNNNDSFLETSEIQLVGNSRIGVEELCREDKFVLNNMPLCPPVSETFEADIVINMKMNNRFSGFLTSRRNTILWNRHWCVLIGFCLMFWNSPTEENESDPLEIIDLQKCITKSVEPVDRSLCSRTRTFLLELKTEELSPLVRYFLSADSVSELSEWKRHIDITLDTIRFCHKLKCKTTVFL